jgi:hypothetical protein
MDMEQIKSGNVIKSPEIVLDPTFFLPPDVVDVRVGNANDPSEDDGATFDDVVDSDDVLVTDEDLAGGDDSAPIDDDGEGVELLPTPQWMNIIDQQVRIAPDGKAVVDVVIELEDVSGATEYDVRITKS